MVMDTALQPNLQMKMITRCASRPLKGTEVRPDGFAGLFHTRFSAPNTVLYDTGRF